MKRTVRLSLGMSFIMLALVLIAPHLAPPKLVLSDKMIDITPQDKTCGLFYFYNLNYNSPGSGSPEES